MRFIILSFIFLFSVVSAESIITTAGEFHSGEIIEETQEFLVIESDEGIVELAIEDIKERIITFDEDSKTEKKEYQNKRGLRFSYNSGLGEAIFTHDDDPYNDGSTKNVFINQISEFGLFYYLDVWNGYSAEIGAGKLQRLCNVGELSNQNNFNASFVSLTVRKMTFRSLSGGYLFKVGAGINLYFNPVMNAYDGTNVYAVSYEDSVGYHLLIETWSAVPRVAIFEDMNFVMGLRWNFGSQFKLKSSTPVNIYPDWNNLGLNGLTFNASIAFMF